MAELELRIWAEACFMVKEQFNITGRGLVMTGDATGAVRPGQWFWWRHLQFQCRGVERMGNRNPIGLLVGNQLRPEHIEAGQIWKSEWAEVISRRTYGQDPAWEVLLGSG